MACFKYQIPIGTIFGSLTVLDEAKSGWICKCVCGTTKHISGSQLIRGKSTSCGCKQYTRLGQRKYDFEESTWRVLWTSHKSGAMKKNRTYLTFDEYVNQLKMNPNCWYCGIDPPTREPLLGRQKSAPINAHGIDRIDSSLGYLAGNIRTCCKECNIAKNNRSEDDFIASCCRISEIHGEK